MVSLAVCLSWNTWVLFHLTNGSKNLQFRTACLPELWGSHKYIFNNSLFKLTFKYKFQNKNLSLKRPLIFTQYFSFTTPSKIREALHMAAKVITPLVKPWGSFSKNDPIHQLLSYIRNWYNWLSFILWNCMLTVV